MKKIITLALATLVSIVLAAQTQIDNLYFNLNDDDNTATLTYKASNMYKGIVEIPETVEFNNKTYTVTSIGENAFGYYCKEVTSVTLPATITAIESNAFYDCKALTTITLPENIKTLGNFIFNGSGITSLTIMSKTAPQIGEKTFKNFTTSNVTLTVPAGCKSEYEKNETWKSFKEIVELKNENEEEKENDDDNGGGNEPTPTAINSVTNALNIAIAGKTVSVANVDEFAVLDVTGNIIGKGSKVTVPHSGIYFIVAGKKTAKIYVK